MSYLEVGGRKYTIPAGETRIGSDPGCQILLSGSGVMAVHAVLQGLPDGQVVIKRAGAGTEILINGVRLGPQPSPLLHGDKVQIGEHELLFVDERRSGSTQYIQAVNPALLAQARGVKPAKERQPTAGTGGRVVSLTDGREYVITGTSMVFGRDAGCDVVIADRNVSRRHCEILSTPKGYLLIDSSTNGTFLNGERVEGQKLLARGDVIRIGNEEFRFYADPVPAQTQAPASRAPGPSAAAPEVKSPIPQAELLEETRAPHQEPPQPKAPPGAEYRLAHTQMGIPAQPAAKGEAVASPPAAKPSKGPAVLANLVVRSGVLKGQRLPIRVPIVNVGRAEYNDIVLPDDSVSTVHAKIQRREGIWMLVDLDSTNGSYVDGERVQGEAPLSPGAIVRFGAVQTIFEPVDDTIDAAKGSSTKLMSAIRIPPPEPPSGGGPGSRAP
jgi:pSer/pThr/pTyr-binding forkhead associated (FHA) protein